jgi:hypothetical protein
MQKYQVEIMSLIVVPLWLLTIFLVFYNYGFWAGIGYTLLTFIILGNLTA